MKKTFGEREGIGYPESSIGEASCYFAFYLQVWNSTFHFGPVLQAPPYPLALTHGVGWLQLSGQVMVMLGAVFLAIKEVRLFNNKYVTK